MNPLDAFHALVAELGQPRYAESIAAHHAVFQKRTGSFGPEDAWFEARSRAFWDDAVTSGGLGGLAEGAPAEARAWVPVFARAHRGLFVVVDRDDATVLRDLVTGVELFVDETDLGTKDALEAASAPFDGRIVASDLPVKTALLPGAVFHPEDAKEPIVRVLAAAREKGLGAHATLDALLCMEKSLRSLSRVKATYAYRLEALRV